MIDSNEDWKEKLLKNFQNWLEEIEEFPEEYEFEQESPDLMSFYKELVALRQELSLRTRSEQRSSNEAIEIQKKLDESLSASSSDLASALSEVKAQIPEAQEKAENTILLELIDLREALAESFRQFKSKKLTGIFVSKKNHLLLQQEQEKFSLLLKRTDDILRRFEVRSVVTIGDKFDSLKMRVVSTEKDSSLPSGTVSKIFRQGFVKRNKILITAEVEVVSKIS